MIRRYDVCDHFYQNYLLHYGVLGMKWGVRRYQNEDGTLTEAGKDHYVSRAQKHYQKFYDKYSRTGNSKKMDKAKAALDKQKNLDKYYEAEYRKQTKGDSFFQRAGKNLLDYHTSNSYLKDIAKNRQKNNGKLSIGRETLIDTKHAVRNAYGTAAKIGVVAVGTWAVKSGLAKGLGQVAFSKILNEAKARRGAREAAALIPKIADHIVSYVADTSEYIVR